MEATKQGKKSHDLQVPYASLSFCLHWPCILYGSLYSLYCRTPQRYHFYYVYSSTFALPSSLHTSVPYIGECYQGSLDSRMGSGLALTRFQGLKCLKFSDMEVLKYQAFKVSRNPTAQGKDFIVLLFSGKISFIYLDLVLNCSKAWNFFKLSRLEK